MKKLGKYILVILFFVGLTLFAFSLMPVFRAFSGGLFWIMTLVGFITSFFCMFGLIYRPKEKIKLDSKYVKKGALMSRAEYEFLQTLRSISPDKYEVVPQVCLSSVIDKKTNTTYRNELFRICDYCFVDRDTFEPLLLVELNDSSHRRADRRDRDAKVATICKSAKMPLVTFWMDEDLTFGTVRKTVLKAIKG